MKGNRFKVLYKLVDFFFEISFWMRFLGPHGILSSIFFYSFAQKQKKKNRRRKWQRRNGEKKCSVNDSKRDEINLVSAKVLSKFIITFLVMHIVIISIYILRQYFGSCCFTRLFIFLLLFYAILQHTSFPFCLSIHAKFFSLFLLMFIPVNSRKPNKTLKPLQQNGNQ